MELKQIRDIMSAMRRNQARRLVFEQEGVKLEIELDTGTSRDTGTPSGESVPSPQVYSPLVEQAPVFRHLPAAMIHPPSMPVESNSVKQESESAPLAVEAEEKKRNDDFVKSPIVGTFYVASSPDVDPFIQAGDQVDEDTVVCIVEAMKVMNEVKAGVKGRVAEVLVANGQPVEFGTKLIRVEK